MSDTTVIVTEDSPHLVETPGSYGPPGKGLEFDVTGDQVGVRLQGETAYVYTDPLTGPAGSNDWGDLVNVPAAFPPAAHSHAIGDTSGLQSALDAKQASSAKGAANGYAGLGADGKVPEAQLPPVGVASEYQEFLTSGTWTKPAGVKWVYVELVGGGGAGAAASSQQGGLTPGGGGGGGFASGVFLASSLGSSVSVTVGAGGPGQTSTGAIVNGGDGGNSAFGSLLTAPGGAGGTDYGGAGANIAPAVNENLFGDGYGGDNSEGCGSVSGGGGGGGPSSSSGTDNAAGGVSSNAGNGGTGKRNSPFGALSGDAGEVPGGGGGGTHHENSDDATGGDGGNGRVRIWAW